MALLCSWDWSPWVSWRFQGRRRRRPPWVASPLPPSEDADAPELPPLVVDKEAPLLLSGSSDEEDPELRAEFALNSACFVCHGNYEREPLARIHATEEIGCVDCHGASFAHRNDENNITPPDVLYPLEAIDAACEECHDSHDVAATEVLARWQERCPEKRDVSQIVCTDCHGQHRLKLRTVRWDKKTGKLIPPEEKTIDSTSPAP